MLTLPLGSDVNSLTRHWPLVSLGVSVPIRHRCPDQLGRQHPTFKLVKRPLVAGQLDLGLDAGQVRVNERQAARLHLVKSQCP